VRASFRAAARRVVVVVDTRARKKHRRQVRLLKALGLVEADGLTFAKVRAFLPAVLMFYASIAANLRLLSAATVDTFIVARSVTPIATRLGETVFFSASLPSVRASLSLLTIAVGASGYALSNARALADAQVAFWAAAYVCCVSTDMLVVKRVVTEVRLKPWGYVYYNNLLALACYPAWALLTGEARQLAADYRAAVDSRRAELSRIRGDMLSDTTPGLGGDPASSGAAAVPSVGDAPPPGVVSVVLDSALRLPVALDPAAFRAVFVSCAIGLGISFFGLNARRALSATAFTVLGAACKFLSIVINTLCWRHHAPRAALPWLCASLAGSIMYQQVVSTKKQSTSPGAASSSASATAATTTKSSSSSSAGAGAPTAAAATKPKPAALSTSRGAPRLVVGHRANTSGAASSTSKAASLPLFVRKPPQAQT